MADMILRAQRCSRCGAEAYPPTGICRRCGSRAVDEVPIDGPARVETFTVNHQQYGPGWEVPTTYVIVEWDGRPDVKVLGALHAADADHVAIGLPVTFDGDPSATTLPTFKRT